MRLLQEHCWRYYCWHKRLLLQHQPWVRLCPGTEHRVPMPFMVASPQAPQEPRGHLLSGSGRVFMTSAGRDRPRGSWSHSHVCRSAQLPPGGPGGPPPHSTGPGAGTTQPLLGSGACAAGACSSPGAQRGSAKDDTMLLLNHLVPRLRRSRTWCCFGTGGNVRQAKSRRFRAESTKLRLTGSCQIFLNLFIT